MRAARGEALFSSPFPMTWSHTPSNFFVTFPFARSRCDPPWSCFFHFFFFNDYHDVACRFIATLIHIHVSISCIHVIVVRFVSRFYLFVTITIFVYHEYVYHGFFSEQKIAGVLKVRSVLNLNFFSSSVFARWILSFIN